MQLLLSKLEDLVDYDDESDIGSLVYYISSKI